MTTLIDNAGWALARIDAAKNLAEIALVGEQISASSSRGVLNLTKCEGEEITRRIMSRVKEMGMQSNAQLPRLSEELALLERVKQLDHTAITIDFLIKYDGVMKWIRDDFLTESEVNASPEVMSFLWRVAEVKAEARKQGHVFSG